MIAPVEPADTDSTFVVYAESEYQPTKEYPSFSAADKTKLSSIVYDTGLLCVPPSFLYVISYLIALNFA